MKLFFIIDEHRLGLQPILRRVWTPIGEQPIAGVKPQYKWLWLYGFVHPESRENKAWILPSVNTELFSQVLADFAREFQLNKNKPENFNSIKTKEFCWF